ncbi:MAG: endonuclease NucS domain-containing protein, partial [Candidatus Bathyarchaeia archaeon]
GFVDVYGVDADGRLVVLEIKRRTAGKGAALQLARYIEAIKGDSDREVRGIIVAPSLAKGVQPLLATLNLEFKALSPRRCAQVLGRAEREKRLDSYLR